MRTGDRLILCAAIFGLSVTPALAVKPVEKTEHYAVSGQTGTALYDSIGANGPVITGGRRTIAHTTFKLTWKRDYRVQGDGSCKIAVNIPRLIITYTLPKPSGSLPSGLKASWQRFYDGLAAHEKVHGAQIVDMVEKIEAMSVGLSAPADPKCQKVRALLQARLKDLSDARVAESRHFDKAEMGPGGHVQGLIFDLVKGP